MVVEFCQMEFKWLMSNWRVDIYRRGSVGSYLVYFYEC